MVEKRSLSSKIILYIVLILLTFITLLPLIWMLSASLKTNNEVFSIPIKWLPSVPQWMNYKIIFEKVDLLLFTFNSFKLSIIITIIQVATSCFAAYGFTKCKFKGRDLLFFCYVATIAIPWQVYMLPQFIQMRQMNLTDNHLGYILLQSFMAFGVFLVRQFYMSIPDELLEAARIDGLNEYGIFLRIILPLSKPVISTLAIMSFVTIWNDLMGPMIYFDSKSNKTIPLGIRMFISQYGAEYSLIMAASVLALIPVVAVFLFFQKYFVAGVATSGLKG